MSRDAEYLTSNRHIRYPFADDSKLPRSDSLSSVVFGCFVDAAVQIKSPYSDIVPVVSGINLQGHTLGFSLVSSSTESVMLTCTRSLTRFPVVYGETEWCWYVFVLSSDGIKEFEEYSGKIGNISTSVLHLNTRCTGNSSPYVSSLRIFGGEKKKRDGTRYTRTEALLKDPDIVLGGDVVFQAGYNMTFGEESSGFSINAIPGAGMGIAPCGCEDSAVEFKTPGILSQDGHLRLFNDTCYDLIPSEYQDDEGNTKGLLSVHVKCKACCTCAMYESIVNNRLIPLRDSILASRSVLNRVYDKYESNVEKWNTRIATALPEDIVITSTGITLDAAATELRPTAAVNGKMDRCGFSMTMRNDSFVDVTFELDKFSSNGRPFEAQVSYMKTSSSPVVLPVDLEKTSDSSDSSSSPIFSIVLAPGRSATLTYFVRLSRLVKTDHQKGFISRVKVSAYQDGKFITTRTEEMGV